MAEHVLHRGKLFAAIAWLAPAVALATGFGVASACACAVAAMKPINAPCTAISIGFVVAPSKVRPLITVRTMTPRWMADLWRSS